VWLKSICFLQGGVEEETCNYKFEEDIGASTRLDNTGIVEDFL
jgi:hypothetical protein